MCTNPPTSRSSVTHLPYSRFFTHLPTLLLTLDEPFHTRAVLTILYAPSHPPTVHMTLFDPSKTCNSHDSLRTFLLAQHTHDNRFYTLTVPIILYALSHPPTIRMTLFETNSRFFKYLSTRLPYSRLFSNPFNPPNVLMNLNEYPPFYPSNDFITLNEPLHLLSVSATVAILLSTGFDEKSRSNKIKFYQRKPFELIYPLPFYKFSYSYINNPQICYYHINQSISILRK